MSLGKKPAKRSPKNKLDGKTHLAIVKKTGRMVDRTLEGYGLPEMSLDELRATVDQELGDASIADLVLKDREAGR